MLLCTEYCGGLLHLWSLPTPIVFYLSSPGTHMYKNNVLSRFVVRLFVNSLLTEYICDYWLSAEPGAENLTQLLPWSSPAFIYLFITEFCTSHNRRKFVHFFFFFHCCIDVDLCFWYVLENIEIVIIVCNSSGMINFAEKESRSC